MNRTHLWGLLGFALLLRLISLATYPLMDTTEARYGEMARLMVETGNWLTPQFDYGVPFWGKPPLFTWMSAAGIELFGLSEFAVRAPHWLAGVATILLMAYFTRKSGYSALVTSIVLATCGIFSIAAGAVMTDMALTLSMTIAMLGFYFCWLGEGKTRTDKIWGYIGFVGLACGLLAKGPVAIVIMGIAVFPWLVLQHGFIGAFTELWKRFPIVTGTGLMLVIALPWYVMAEVATPGFIDYFIVGEHFKRFVVSGWEGDLYGSAHDEPRGMIWLFWLQAAAPWSLVIPLLAFFRKEKITQANQQNPGLFSFLVCWLVSPLILFSLAGNILPAYVLPGIPALGLLVAMLVMKKDTKWFSSVAMVLPVLLMIAMLVLNLGKADQKSDRVIFANIHDDAQSFYIGKRPFSGQFYSQGKAVKLQNMNELEGLDKFYLIGKSAEVKPVIVEQSLTCTLEFTAKSKRALYSCFDASPVSVSAENTQNTVNPS
ncbi:glycosyltransferase family 39 protein [Vibrio sp. T187]|uniref:ArnT family glycosyltransferase n=1 Tax=Vibrio TaxID=662 RepID=UPI0010C98A33|nr:MULTISPECIES: glycosyltransferase family 39 protein [Vibrio]MBW3694734.1 glycosyltransferase family 39 protein [Vibrio sp. T187]